MKHELDHQTADRLAQGQIEASDAPPGFEAVADLLSTAKLATAHEPNEAVLRSTVRAMSGAAQTALGTAPARTQPVRLKRSVKAAGALALALSLTGGLAAADVVPERVQRQVRHRVAVAVDRAGLDVLLTPEAKQEARHPENHGGEVSDVARETPLEGREKGEAVSTVARSDAGKSEDGRRPGDPGRRQEPPRERGEDPRDRDQGTGNDGRQRPPAEEPAPRPEAARLACAGATREGTASVECKWESNSSPQFTGYRLHRSTGDGERTVVFRSSDRTITTYTDAAVRSGTRYSYVLEVLGADGRTIARSEPSNVACCADGASAPPPPRPEAMRLGCAPANTEGGPVVGCRWSESQARQFASYRLTRVDAPTRERSVVFTGTERSGTRAIDSGVRNGTEYGYFVEALDSAGRVVGRSEMARVSCCPQRS